MSAYRKNCSRCMTCLRLVHGFLVSRRLVVGANTTWRVSTVLLAFMLPTAAIAADHIRVGTSEFVYSDLTQQIGGAAVSATLLNRQMTGAGTRNSVAGNDLIISGGGAADGWLRDAARNSSPRPVLFEVEHYAADKRNTAESPIYDSYAIAAAAQDIAKELCRRAPAEAPTISASLARYTEALKPIDRKTGEIARDFRGTTVFLTRTAFRGLVNRLHFQVQNEAFLKASNGGLTPSPATMAELKEAVGARKAAILIYDRDAKSADAKDLVDIANDSGVPAVGLSEKLPSGLHYQQWMLRQLNAIRGALNEASP
jgi:zinc/manganese transport system substrate-binding protein